MRIFQDEARFQDSDGNVIVSDKVQNDPAFVLSVKSRYTVR